MNVTLQYASERLVEEGIRITRQRELILQYVYGEKALSHPSAEQLFETIYADHPKVVSLPTVYKNIRVLRQLGLLNELYIGQNGIARYDKLLHPHHHLHCTCCGSISDVVPALWIQQEAPAGFQVDHVYVEISGTCESCRAKQSSNLAIAM
ncbi:transcriptional repressor [Paenibacillus sp. H1-7]|uniref:Fur family transcriptional regulator n=1 Tax=Paenibacillus sp. H1-7 TaxID=2282849 RepID=UPI001EF986D6|nr:Fur family transcriptional regulator [Paenibacillus sp. H1-7]ULL18650.1 transcriptional repressor [Paenibacillus sp. H1-7]